MPKSLKYILVLLIIGLVVSYCVYKYAMKPVADTASLKSEASLTYIQLNDMMTANDITKLNELTNKVISVSGVVKDIQNEDTLITVKIGDTSNSNEIICQADKRHIDAFKEIKVFENIKIKGVCSGYASDDLGLGASLQIKNCIKE